MIQNPMHALRACALALALVGAAGALAPAAAADGVVNVNTATAEQLMALPGVGESKARAILEAREARGRFESIDELTQVKGIGAVGLERMRPFLALQGRTTLLEE